MSNDCNTRVTWHAKSDDELADAAETGLAGQGSVVEAMRRLRGSATSASWAMIGLTVVLVILTITLVVLTFILVRQGE